MDFRVDDNRIREDHNELAHSDKRRMQKELSAYYEDLAALENLAIKGELIGAQLVDWAGVLEEEPNPEVNALLAYIRSPHKSAAPDPEPPADSVLPLILDRGACSYVIILTYAFETDRLTVRRLLQSEDADAAAWRLAE